MGRWSRLVLLISLGLGAALVGVELLITAVALPAILADLTDWTELRRASWIVNGYLLAYIATMPLAGRAADRFGLPLLTGLALAVFAVGSVFAGAAQDLDQLIAARVLQGIGGGAIVPLATAGASHLYEGPARARALGFVGALTFLGMAIGPFLGATVLQGLELGTGLRQAGLQESALFLFATPAWRWIFYLGAPLALLAMTYLWAAAPVWDVQRGKSRLDVLGAGLFTTALATGLLALTTFDQPQVPGDLLGPIQLGVIALVTAIAALLRMAFAREPFIPLGYFRDRNFSNAVLLSLLTGYALATAIIGGAVFVDRVRFGGPETQRIVLGALAGAMAVGALVSGFLLRWAGVVPLTLLGIALGAGGMGLLATATADLPDTTLDRRPGAVRPRLRPDRDPAVERRRRGTRAERVRHRVRRGDRRKDDRHGRRVGCADGPRLDADRGAEPRPDRPGGARPRAPATSAGPWPGRRTRGAGAAALVVRAGRDRSSRGCSSSPAW